MFFTPVLQSTNAVTTVPAPIGGLNARDSLAAMEPTDAVVLENWWPQPFGCSVRNGFVEWTELETVAATLASWAGRTGTQKLFAWTVNDMFDVTANAPVGAAIVTGLANGYWSSVQMNNAAANTLIAVNGTDNPIFYNGVIGRYTGVEWVGFTPANAAQITIHQKRIWVTEKDTCFGWFLPPDAIIGTFLRADFGPSFHVGAFCSF